MNRLFFSRFMVEAPGIETLFGYGKRSTETRL
jgi:hypothetical protein